MSLAFKTGQQIQGCCEWTFERLPPGDFVALLTAPSGSGGSQVFSITDNRPATVVIAAPEVRLSGQVTRNGEPVARTHVRILSFPFSRPAVVVLTDVQGRYAATIDRPGLNRVDAHGVGMVESKLASGTNVVNIPGMAAQ